MQNNQDNRDAQRNLPPKGRSPAARQNAARARQQRPSPAGGQPRPNRNRSAGAQPRPARPVQRQSSPPKRKPAQKIDAGRNLTLFAVLLILVTLCIIIFGVQSCIKAGREETENDVRDTVKLNTPKAPDTGSHLPVLAQYTDQSKSLTIDSSYGVLIDLDKKEVIASKSADDRIYPASMTKIMTLIVASENIKDLDDTFTFTAEIIDQLYVQNASVAGFSPGETVPLKDIIYGCILPSGADCTTALAIYVAGSEEEFVKMMNEKASDLGLENTHFVTASGLHNDDHYSTCREMAVILEYAIKNENMRKVLSTYKYTTSSTVQHPDGITVTSTLFSRMSGDEADGVFVQGGKTGYTLEGKNCLATFAANCTENTAAEARPQYLLVTAYATGEYTPIFDAINTYKEFCSDR